ncbi:MAG: FlgD immunoglobulin-like domain containing protein [candidate division KSB1 bacterium]|nr:FlgD immunoglobulin-like domain containing protein [candidate division KSB1 bacterium]
MNNIQPVLTYKKMISLSIFFEFGICILHLSFVLYDLAQNSRVEIILYNMNGQQITTLYNGRRSAGQHELHWNGCGTDGALLPAGVYLLQMRAGSFRDTQKLLYIK